MKVWKITWTDASNKTHIRWRSSYKAAQSRVCRVKQEFDGNLLCTGVELVCIPSSKAMLIDWLNNNLTMSSEDIYESERTVAN